MCGVVPRGPRPSYLPRGPEGGGAATPAGGPPRGLRGWRTEPRRTLSRPRRAWTKPVRSRLPVTVTLSVCPALRGPPCQGAIRPRATDGHSEAGDVRRHGDEPIARPPGAEPRCGPEVHAQGHVATCRRSASEATSAMARADSRHKRAVLERVGPAQLPDRRELVKSPFFTDGCRLPSSAPSRAGLRRLTAKPRSLAAGKKAPL